MHRELNPPERPVPLRLQRAITNDELLRFCAKKVGVDSRRGPG